MCKADEAPLTMRWLDDTPKPNGNPDIAHECTNWNLLFKELTRISVNPSVFVHPKFGKLFINHTEEFSFALLPS